MKLDTKELAYSYTSKKLWREPGEVHFSYFLHNDFEIVDAWYHI